MRQISTSKFKEKKSKFFGFLYSLNDLEEIKLLVDEIKKNHKKATHVCYGINFKDNQSFKNDGEVGFPGKTLMNILIEKNYNNHILVVVRYFGGIKLGPGGVSRAFKQTGLLCFD